MKPREKTFYGWFIVAIAFATMTAAYSVYLSWPVFYVAILDEFKWSRADTALIFSLATLFYIIGGPVSGTLFDKIGPKRLFTIGATLLIIGVIGLSRSNEIWQLSLFYGCFVALGAALCGMVPTVALISAWFEKRRGTAVGIAQMGTRDAFLFTPLIQLFISLVGWRNTYLIMIAFPAIILPLAQFVRGRPQDMGLLPDGSKTPDKKEGDTKENGADNRIVNREWANTDWTVRKAAKKYQFWAFFFLMFGAGASFNAFINHFVALTTDIGFSAMFAARLLLIFAITAIIGRLSGFVSDIIGREWTCTISVALMLFSLPILLITKDTSSPWILYIFIALYGFGGGMYAAPFTAAAADLFQGKHFGSIFGTANMGFGLGSSIGTWLYGYIFDVTGNYDLAIVAVMFAVSLIGISIWIASPRKVRRVPGRAAKIKIL